MRVIDRYILHQGALAFIVTSLMLLGLFGFFDLGSQLDDVGQGRYSTMDAVLFTLLGMPQRLVTLMPFAALLAGVISLGMMAQRSELVILRGAGLSPWRMARLAIAAGLILATGNAALQLTLAPKAAARGAQLRSTALANQPNSGDGLWIRSRRGVIHVGSLIDGHIPHDIEAFEYADNHTLRSYLHAQKADVPGHAHWHLHNVLIKHFNQKGSIDQREQHQRLDWRPGLYPGQLDLINQPAATLSPLALQHYVTYLDRHHQYSQIFRVALWQKLATLATTLAMLLLAVPMAFANPRGAGLGIRLVGGSLAGLGLYGLGQAMANIAILYHLPAPLAALTPAVCIALLAIIWLRRIG